MIIVAVTLVLVCLLSFTVGYLIADGLRDKRYWDRQNHMSKINKKF